jgi:RNA exonuclease 1
MGNSDGCTTGAHVFYESKPELLHSRHPFTHSRPSTASALDGINNIELVDTALDVACLDCEMVYTTAGMSLARVSVVDGNGNEVLDELVRMDEGVEIMYDHLQSSLVSCSRCSLPATTTLVSPALELKNTPKRH